MVTVFWGLTAVVVAASVHSLTRRFLCSSSRSMGLVKRDLSPPPPPPLCLESLDWSNPPYTLLHCRRFGFPSFSLPCLHRLCSPASVSSFYRSFYKFLFFYTIFQVFQKCVRVFLPVELLKSIFSSPGFNAHRFYHQVLEFKTNQPKWEMNKKNIKTEAKWRK